MRHFSKASRFFWRLFRNAAATTPPGRQLLFPQHQLAARFGRGDAEYAWKVFEHHRTLLDAAGGFGGAERMLEIGPGRNLGTSLLWWAWNSARSETPVHVVLWDVFPNAQPNAAGFWEGIAKNLLSSDGFAVGEAEIRVVLEEVASGARVPEIDYRVEPIHKLAAAMSDPRLHFDLIYSQAAIEHIWDVGQFWECIASITKPGGWHSHRIDLADHGRRDTHYIEMLEWSALSYWLTMRFIPGATNRWRVKHHLEKLGEIGLRVQHSARELRDVLPVPLARLSPEFRHLDEVELRTTALDVVARKAA